MSRTREFHFAQLGEVPYANALAIQRAAAQARIDGALATDVLMLLEHPAVITLGRSTNPNHLLTDAASLATRGVELFEVERGGDITYHGPGQLVGYPIIDLQLHKPDLHWYLRQLEEVMIRALASFSIGAERRDGLTGVWTSGRKIASIGVHARTWVTWHGFALNVTTDLSQFEAIVPCGIEGAEMTSIWKESAIAGRTVPRDLAGMTRAAVITAFGEVFGMKPRAATADVLRIVSPGGSRDATAR